MDKTAAHCQNHNCLKGVDIDHHWSEVFKQTDVDPESHDPRATGTSPLPDVAKFFEDRTRWEAASQVGNHYERPLPPENVACDECGGRGSYARDGGDSRGNTKNRRMRRRWLEDSETGFGAEKKDCKCGGDPLCQRCGGEGTTTKVPCYWCGKKLVSSDNPRINKVEQDRLIPEHLYKKRNVVPACTSDNNKRQVNPLALQPHNIDMEINYGRADQLPQTRDELRATHKVNNISIHPLEKTKVTDLKEKSPTDIQVASYKRVSVVHLTGVVNRGLNDPKK